MTDLVEAARFDNRIEADLARLYLEDRGIGAVLFDADINNIFGWFYALLLPERSWCWTKTWLKPGDC